MEINIENYHNVDIVQSGDILFLPLPDMPDYHMCVMSSFLADHWSNDYIFRYLEVDKMKFCSQAYGYRAYDGGCPECNRHDYLALTRLVKAIFDAYIAKQGSIKRIVLGEVDI